MARAKKRKTPKKRTPKKRAPKKRAPRKTRGRKSRAKAPPARGESFPRVSGKGAAIGGAGLLGILAVGGTALAFSRSKTPAAPAPSPVKTPNAAPPPTPAPVTPTEPVEVWSPDHQTLNALTGYHRATQKETNAQAVALVPSLLSNDVGTVHYFTAGGKDYAGAIEMHQNGTKQNPTPHPHKGVSVFVKD